VAQLLPEERGKIVVPVNLRRQWSYSLGSKALTGLAKPVDASSSPKSMVSANMIGLPTASAQKTAFPPWFQAEASRLY